MDALDWLRKHLEADGSDMIREMVQAFAERLMGAEADALCGAGWGERSPERVNSRKGYRHRDFDTRAGTIELAIPKLRHDSYYPGWLLEPCRRAERALTQVVCECYVEGVSTRRVDDIVKAMGIDGISKSQVSKMAKDLDALVEAFRNRRGPLHLRVARRPHPAGPRGRPDRQRRRRGGHCGQRRWAPRSAGPRRDHHRRRRRVDRVLAQPRGPRAVRRRPGHLRRPSRPQSRRRGGEVWPTGWRFQPGHRLRLDISLADFPHQQSDGGAPAALLLHDFGHPSALLLPVVPPSKSAQ